jgi:hypothetical protein
MPNIGFWIKNIGNWPNLLIRRQRVLNRQTPFTFLVNNAEAVEKGAANSDLGAIFFAHDGRFASKWAHYLPAYSEQFSPYRSGFPLPNGSRRPLKMLEIGTNHGGSLQMWRKYFGNKAAIYGIDIDPRCSRINDPDLKIRIGSQADRSFLESVISEMGGVDIVLDDGSHHAKHQRASLEILFPLLSEGGLYAAEDLHTAYWHDYGGGYKRHGSFLEVIKDLIDDMHISFHGKAHKLPGPIAGSVSRITIYNSMVFMKKKPRTREMYLKIGNPSF